MSGETLSTDVGEHDSHNTPLQGVIEAFGLKRMDIVRVANALASSMGLARSVSRNDLWRIERGQGEPKQNTILMIVGAIRELTGLAFRAGDLFRLEPAGAVESADGSNLYVPVFSGGDRWSQAWRISVPEGSPDDSFEKLYSEYGVLLRSVAARRYGLPMEDAEGVVQDVFLSYLQRQTHIRDARGWLYGAVRNRCIDYLRARSREIPLDAEHDETVDERAEIAHDKLVRLLTFSAVIARLGAKCQETLRRRYQGAGRDELAGKLSTTPGNVDQLLSTCRRLAAQTFRRLIPRSK
jgi:RNA polymerase sigma factor (sigma-70 family)